MKTTGDQVDDEIIVVDDFLDDPGPLRAAALKADYPATEEKQYFPGRNSVERYTIPGLTEYVTEIAGQPLSPMPGQAHGRFRACCEGEQGGGGVHIDGSHWSGVLYMTPDEHCRGGTDFFVHRATGQRRAPVYPEDWAAWPVDTPRRFWKEQLEPASNDPSQWELWRHVPMKFNRLILFRPWMFHNAGPGFGDSIENCRLVYLIFFNAEYNAG